MVRNLSYVYISHLVYSPSLQALMGVYLKGMNSSMTTQSVHTIRNKQHSYHLRVDRFFEIRGIDSSYVIEVSSRVACKNLGSKVIYMIG